MSDDRPTQSTRPPSVPVYVPASEKKIWQVVAASHQLSLSAWLRRTANLAAGIADAEEPTDAV